VGRLSPKRPTRERSFNQTRLELRKNVDGERRAALKIFIGDYLYEDRFEKPCDPPARTRGTSHVRDAKPLRLANAAPGGAFNRSPLRCYRSERPHGVLRTLTVHDIAREERVTAAYVYTLLRLPWLAPDITSDIVNGRQPQQLNAKTLMRQASRLPPDWAEQRTLLGFR